MTDVELVEFATAFREGILDSDPSRMMCAAVSWPLAALLRHSGVPCETVETDLGECNHIWIKLGDGRALDPTADQFSTPERQYPPVYLGEPMELHRDRDATSAKTPKAAEGVASQPGPERSEGIAQGEPR